MSDLLELAEAQLGSAAPHSTRMACWLARSAMEEIIDVLLRAKAVAPGDWASARSRLTCLQVAYEGSSIPGTAQYVWSRLSEACHQHAYELAPTYSEAQHLLQLVRALANAGSSDVVAAGT